VVWSPKAIKGFSVSADWFNIDERNLVAGISTTLIVTDVEKLGPKSKLMLRSLSSGPASRREPLR